jgi:two-component system, OmpR family, response regulator
MGLITYLVEDNQTILENLIETLQEIASVEVMGHGATEAEASRWLRSHNGQWQLAILDLFLQEGSGLGVLAACRDRAFHQKVVVLTNYASPEIRKRSAELGADAVFDKSSELDALFAFCIEQSASANHDQAIVSHRRSEFGEEQERDRRRDDRRDWSTLAPNNAPHS